MKEKTSFQSRTPVIRYVRMLTNDDNAISDELLRLRRDCGLTVIAMAVDPTGVPSFVLEGTVIEYISVPPKRFK